MSQHPSIYQSRSNEDVASSSRLVAALIRVRDQEKKSNIRSTDHRVRLRINESDSKGSALVQEEADEERIIDHNSLSKSDSNPADEDTVIITSWKTQEFAYRKTAKIGLDENDELPTLARGLFTMKIGNDRHRIVVRGYDKFFNEEEMPWTKKKSIAAHSTSPYELSFKENGCIIFISALSPFQLIVTSKHSLGSNESHAVSHAQKGEEWLDKHIAKVGKTKSELAAELWERNETAVAELCDDNFEEHVLAYPADRTGLHLHGLNANTADFRTRPMAEVENFAKEWGFLKTRYFEIGNLHDVERFCNSVSETGSWEGIPIEGFVVRTHIPMALNAPPADSKDKVKAAAPPYKPGQAWFYKVKFDEPYLMYRDWRELTRRMLSDKQKYDQARDQYVSNGMLTMQVNADDTSMHSTATIDTEKSKNAKKKEIKKAEQLKRAQEAAAGLVPPLPPQTKSTRPETRLFVQWCYEKLYGSQDGKVNVDLGLFESFHENKGIIKLRQQFIDFMNTAEGKGRLEGLYRATKDKNSKQVQANDTMDYDKPYDKLLIVPIAVPGCGKTALAVAMSQLLPDFGHTQSDNVQSKKTAPTFLRNIGEELKKHNVVFADRNNHLFKHRNEIVDMIKFWQQKTENSKHHVRLVALAWDLDSLPLNAIHHICSDRITRRGENHQSLRLTENKEHEQILWQFLRNLQPFGSAEKGGGDQGSGDTNFNTVIKMNVNASIEQNLEKLIKEIMPLLNLEKPDHSKIKEALRTAMEYRVVIKKQVKGATPARIRYYGLAIESDMVALLQEILAQHSSAMNVFEELKRLDRVIQTPHVTLVHSSEIQPQNNDESNSTTSVSSTMVEEEKKRLEKAQKRWDTYSSLSSDAHPLTFTLKIDLIAWNDRVMALGVGDVSSKEMQSLKELQGVYWRPHITIGTFSESIRPFEANQVLLDADLGTNPESIHCIKLQNPREVQARLKGMT